MSTASHPTKYLSIHRLEGVELRVVADHQVADDPVTGQEDEILALIEVESQVLNRLAQEAQWPHRTVTLFILADLTSLQKQLQALDRRPVGDQLDQMGDLLVHPVVNMYDLANPITCHVFVNRQAMITAGYWNDRLALQGLLAHEHAHPLAECAATKAVRQLQLTLELQLTQPWSPPIQSGKGNALGQGQHVPPWAEHAQRQLNALVQTLVLLGPREVFTNEIALATGFVQPMLYLDRQNVQNLMAALAYRPTLQRQLAEAVRANRLSLTGAAALSLIGDLQAHLAMAMEVAAFQRQGERVASTELLVQLEKDVFAKLDPLVGPLFQKLCASYVRLPTTASPLEMAKFAEEQLALLARTLSQRSLQLTVQVKLKDELN